ncbi:MAG: glycosyltransferase [Deltaproteobacteria bacterium]|nr:glycosyltransferase [Deltaproteobacteria bacterium]
MSITGDIRELIDQYLVREPMAMCRHPEGRSSIYEEAEACIRLGKDDKDVIERQVNRYRAQGYSYEQGIPAAMVMLRRHHDRKVIETMEDWWAELSSFSRRDQLSFHFAAWKNKLQYAVIDDNVRDNVYFKWRPHYSKSRQKDLEQRIPGCDIVVPVFNGLTYAKDCINSILEHTRESPYRLYIIDDCSDSFTREYLTSLSTDHPQMNLHRNAENIGFLKSCNLGMSLGRAPYVVLVNSDVIVTPGWLDRLIRCAESDPRIASVNPFTNHASNINIPMAPGANFYGMDKVLKENSERRYPDVVTGVGFCMLLRRSALEDVGLFDEAYGRGYCEESDLCMRLTTNGYRTVVADDVYVYHKGRGTFADRGERYKHNRRIFDRRWRKEYERQFRDFISKAPLKPAQDMFRVEQQWDPKPSMRETYRRMRERMRGREHFGVVREAVRGLRRLPKAKRGIATPGSVAKVTRHNRLRVTYVLHHLAVAGGVLSVAQLVNELILLGVEARIVALREYPEIYDWKFFTRPIIFHTVSDLVKQFPATDIVMATHWTTAPWVAQVVQAGRVHKGIYFIQDYESWFFPEEDSQSRAEVKETYALIPDKIVKSDWLKGLLAKDGHRSEKIRLGMDLSLFYPRNNEKSSHPVVLAMARPGTPRRGFPHVVEALKRVKDAMPETEIVLFGDYLSSRKIPFSYRDEGIVTDQNRLAELYSTADVFLDGSDFQGFGRTALEAMACGTACVLTDVGGVKEYGRDEENCLLVPPKSPTVFADAIIRTLQDNGLRKKLVRNGLETVKDYCHKREAKETLAFFQRIVSS